MTNHKSAQSNKADTNDIDEILHNFAISIHPYSVGRGKPDDYDKYKTEAITKLEQKIAQETNKAVVAELQRLYDYATNGTRVRTLLGYRIQELTADKESNNG